ncbi:MAG: dephospho-CoA kinase [Rubricella sp.]
MSRKGPFRLGLTGSIAMGKTTTAGFFREIGVPVWDADAAVHALYGPDGAGARAIASIVPAAVGPEGVDRAALRAAIGADDGLLSRIEAAIHPLVAEDRQRFLEDHAAAPLVLFDIPLLFETGADAWLDSVLVVTAPASVQRARALAREGMTEETLRTILARQLPDSEKRKRADYVIDTSLGLDNARRDVRRIVKRIGGDNA